MDRERRTLEALSGLLILTALLGLAFGLPRETSREVQLRVEARRYAFEPAVLRVPWGARVTLELESRDAVHGLYVDGYDVQAPPTEPGHPSTLTFRATRTGRFRIRCSVTCGDLHPFMVGRLEVAPPLSLILSGLLLLIGSTGLGWSWSRRAAPLGAGGRGSARWDLTRLPGLARILRSRLWPWLPQVGILAGFVLVVLAGLLGTPVGNRNLAVVLIWIGWWAALMLLLVPAAGRLWCSLCPLPLPGEWLQRRRIFAVRPGPLPGRSRLPRFLRSGWSLVLAAAGIGIFSDRLLTDPRATAWALLAFAGAALLLSLRYRGRAFCRTLCPVGAFIGTYGDAAPLVLRVRDPEICRRHTPKLCLTGSEAGYGCPWGVYPARLTETFPCGLCTECLKTCDQGNVALWLQAPGRDLVDAPAPPLARAYLAPVLLASALAYAAVLLGPWAEVREAAHGLGRGPWFLYSVLFLAWTLAIGPGTYALAAAWAARREGRSLGEAFRDHSRALVPLGLGVWGAFTLGFVPANLSYLLPVLSDPFGWGWDLFGTATRPWTPWSGLWVPPVQALLLAVGLAGAVAVTRRRSPQGALPVALFAVVAAGVAWGLVL